ncbi:Chain length determinant protein [Fusobacterium varium]|nr:Wzz/FepE/Etk N-terminal domain-containing protein [Fusobacterium varium]VEH38385.1 Chain length determinant protein [Fusobacterium varium]
MNQLEKREYYEEDEIDIYELVDIIIKRKILVLAIFIICSLLGLGVAFFVRSLKQDTLALKFNINYAKLENNYFFAKSGLNFTKINVDNILITNKYVDEFFKLEKLNELYLEKIKEGNRNDYSRSKFLNDILKVSFNRDTNSYTVSVTMKKDQELQKDILNKYITIIESLINIQVDDEIENRYTFVESENRISREKLNKIEIISRKYLKKKK